MQNGAGEAYWAHNPEVRGSKPRSAIFYFLQSSFSFVSIALLVGGGLDLVSQVLTYP